MILNLTIERQGLPPARVRWSTDSFSATHSAAANSDPTIAQLVEQVNEVVPLEDSEWGLEDYAVEANGFECLHFCRVSQVLKDGDELTIRPWQTQEVRFRAISGRRQISADGRHLIDGVSFGRPFLRRGARPQIRIQSKKRARASLDYDDEDEGEEGEERVGLIMDGSAGREDEDDDLNAAYLAQQSGPLRDYMQRFATRSTSQGGQPLKRRLEPAFEDAREGKRIRSALHPANMGRSSRVSSTNSKNVRFQESVVSSSEATPSTIHAPMESDDEDDEEFNPESEHESEDEDSGSESNKENFNPETQEYAPARVPSGAVQPTTAAEINIPPTLTDLTTRPQEPVRASSPDTSEPPSSSEYESSELSSSDESSEETSSDDDSSSDGSEESEDVSDALSRPVQTAETSLSDTSPNPVPPGEGKLATKRRNQRRRQSAQLAKLVAQGELAPDATFEDLRMRNASHASQDKEAERQKFEANRQALLDALADGGVDVTEQAESSGGGEKIGNQQETVTMGQGQSSSRSTSKRQSSSPRRQATGLGLSNATEQSSTPVQNKTDAAANLAEETPAETKRRRVDKGAAQRLLMGGLGMRMPKNKADEDKLREKSREKSQKDFEKHQKRGDKDTAQAEVTVAEDWRDHIDLKSVECADLSIQYSKPPFPFEQRWDPLQHYDNWRPRNGKKKGKNAKRKRSEQYAEDQYYADMYDEPEHFDASMYDDEAEVTADQDNQVAADPEPKQPPPAIDVSEKVDLLLEHALVGAKIAFKHLEVSEATGWSPAISVYKSGIVTANEDGQLTLTLDEQFRVEKEVDPETGEVVTSNFIVADAQDDEEDGVLELSYSELIEPKLLVAGVTPFSSQQDRSSGQSLAKQVNAIDAIATAVDGSPSKESFKSNVETVKSSMNSTVDMAVTADEGDDTAVETSFNTSTQTVAEYQNETTPKPKEPVSQIDAASRDEASMLIRDAGFRSAVDPEATRPLENHSQTDYPNVPSGGSGREVRSQQTEFKGFSDPPIIDNEDDDFIMNGASSPMDEDLPQPDEPTNEAGTSSTGYRDSDSREKSSVEIDLGLGSSFTSKTNAQVQPEIDIVSLHDSSQEMATETLPDIIAETPELEIGTPSSVMHRPSQAVDIAQQILNPHGTKSTPSREDSPEAAPISPEDVEEIATGEDEEDDDALRDIESLLNYTKNKMISATQPQSLSASQPAPKTKGKRTYGSAPSASHLISLTQPEPTRSAKSLLASSTQPEPIRNTRAAVRHASAKANTITISDDDDDDDDDGPGSLPPSTAPPVTTGFTPINRAVTKALSSSQPVRRRHTANAVDLTNARTSSLDVDSDDDAASFSISPRVMGQSAAFKERLKNRKSSERTKSQV